MSRIKYWVARRVLGMERIGCLPKLDVNEKNYYGTREGAWCDTLAVDCLAPTKGDSFIDYFDSWAFTNETKVQESSE